MAKGVNKVTLVGNLGQEPEVRNLPNGGTVVNLRLATTDSWMDRQSGQRQERTEWHTVVMFNQLAEIAQQYLRKGSRLYVEGRLQTRKWQAQDGQDRYATEVVGNEMLMLDGKPDGQPAPPPHQQQQQRPAPQQQQGYAPPGQANQAPPPGMADPYRNDIPF